jgi:hypothetical protein
MKMPKNIVFRAIRIVVITAVAFAVIVYVHMRRQATTADAEPCANTHSCPGHDHE